MTLWPSEDITGAELMNNFYHNLAANQNIGDALNHAKLQYLEQTDEIGAHPSYWAGYIVIGDTSSTFIPDKPKVKYYYLFPVIGLLLLLVGIAAYKKRRKRKQQQ
jgi:hypothetical protein